MQTNFAVEPCRACAGEPLPCRSRRDGCRAELRRVMRQICDPRAPNLILAAQAGDVGTGSPRSTASLPPCSCCKVLTVNLRPQFSPYFGQSLVLRRVQKVGVRSLLPQIEEPKQQNKKPNETNENTHRGRRGGRAHGRVAAGPRLCSERTHPGRSLSPDHGGKGRTRVQRTKRL